MKAGRNSQGTGMSSHKTSFIVRAFSILILVKPMFFSPPCGFYTFLPLKPFCPANRKPFSSFAESNLLVDSCRNSVTKSMKPEKSIRISRKETLATFSTGVKTLSREDSKLEHSRSRAAFCSNFLREFLVHTIKSHRKDHEIKRIPREEDDGHKCWKTTGKKTGRSQWDSNPRPLDPESNAISTPLCDHAAVVPKPTLLLKHQRPRSESSAGQKTASSLTTAARIFRHRWHSR